MKFNDTHLVNYTLIKDRDGIKKPCMICKEPTEYIDFCYEGRICSTECLDKMDESYNEIVAQMHEGEILEDADIYCCGNCDDCKSRIC